MRALPPAKHFLKCHFDFLFHGATFLVALFLVGGVNYFLIRPPFMFLIEHGKKRKNCSALGNGIYYPIADTVAMKSIQIYNYVLT